jgi:adenylate cyclase
MRKRSFRIRLVAMTTALVVVPLIAIGWLLIDVNRRALEESIRTQLRTVVADLARAGDRALDDSEATLRAIAATLADGAAPADVRIAVAQRLVSANPAIDQAGIYDADGQPIEVVIEPGSERLLPATAPAELRARAQGGLPAIGPAFTSAGGPRVLMVVPVRGAAATWYVMAPVSLAAVQDQVEQVAHEAFKDDLASVFIVDANLRIVAHPDPERAYALPAARTDGVVGVLGKIGSSDPARPSAFDAFGVYPRTGGRVVGAARSLREVPWVVIAERPEAEVFASIPRMRRAVIIAIALAMLAAVGGALVWSGRLAAPVRALVRFADDLAHRRFDRRVAVTTGDELEDLATAMSGAAADLAASDQTIARERKIRGDLGRYLPAQLVDQIVAGDQPLTLGGQRRTITVVFADVASFTSLVEKLPPEQVVAILNQLFTILTEIVFRHGGTVDKFIGDCVMAFWGAPADQPDHAARAVAAAEDMLRWLEVGNEAWQAQYGVTIHLAIGVQHRRGGGRQLRLRGAHGVHVHRRHRERRGAARGAGAAATDPGVARDPRRGARPRVRRARRPPGAGPGRAARAVRGRDVTGATHPARRRVRGAETAGGVVLDRYRLRRRWAPAAWARCGAPATRASVARSRSRSSRSATAGAGAVPARGQAGGPARSPRAVQGLRRRAGDGPRGFLVMELSSGATLFRRADGGLPLSRALAVTAEVARAMEHAHQAGMIHRDLKPDNILDRPSRRRARGGDRLRPGVLRRRRRRHRPADPGRRHRRHADVHVARAGARGAADRGLRRLRARLHPVRAVRRSTALRRRRRAGDEQTRLHRAAGLDRAGARPARRGRRPGRADAAEGARRSTDDGRGRGELRAPGDPARRGRLAAGLRARQGGRGSRAPDGDPDRVQRRPARPSAARGTARSSAPSATS